jgi:hypothetical protein
MDFREREGDFQGADRRYAELTRQRDAGSISEEEFDTQRQRLMVRDDEGRWWAKLGVSGEWHYRDAQTWVRGTPPGYREEVVRDQTNFEEVDRRYAELKGLFEGGEITEEEFDEQLKRLMVQDQGGRWWAKSRETGEWNYHDGSAWVRGTPPGYSPPTHDQNGGEQHRRGTGSTVSLIVVPIVGLVVVVGVAVGASVFLSSSETTSTNTETTSTNTETTSTSSQKARVEKAGSESTSPAKDPVVPDLRGKAVSEAAQAVGTDFVLESGLVFGRGVEGQDLTDNLPTGTIVTQDPVPSSREIYSPGTVIEVNLSGGQEDVVVPEVTGLPVLRAAKILLDAGLKPQFQQAPPNHYEIGDIKVRFDRNGNPEAAIAQWSLSEDRKDVTEWTVTGSRLGGVETAEGKAKPGTIVFLQLS